MFNLLIGECVENENACAARVTDTCAKQDPFAQPPLALAAYPAFMSSSVALRPDFALACLGRRRDRIVGCCFDRWTVTVSE
jgi:hypothetical protein